MERYTTSVLTATLTPPAEPVPEFRAMMQSLSEDSCNKYRQIVYEDPGPFFVFLQQVPPDSLSGPRFFFLSYIVYEDPDFLKYFRWHTGFRAPGP